MKKRFKRIKWNEKEVTLEWTTQDGSETHDHQLTCKDAPKDSFNAALQALRDDVLTISQLDKQYGEDMRVQSVSLSLSEKTGTRGAVVTALKSLDIANAPLALHTPHLVSEGADDDGGADAKPNDKTGVMPDGMWDRIEELETEAWAYLSGQRAPKAQTEMPLETPKEPAKPTRRAKTSMEPELEGAGV
ncbi:MAG: hypothetical protein JWL61_4052 [Gemmatimonadetes bacterium]|nr:hypothetical protein [Gemmatimonadota bacterium]